MPNVELGPVDEATLAELVAAAVADAAPDEVTPPLTSAADWTPARIEWLRGYHRTRREGLGGPAAEATWAVRTDGRVVGAVRLAARDDPAIVELGIWLIRASRRGGVGGSAVAAVLREAALLGRTTVVAETTVANAPALALLSRYGFACTRPDPDDRVHAELTLPT